MPKGSPAYIIVRNDGTIAYGVDTSWSARGIALLDSYAGTISKGGVYMIANEAGTDNDHAVVSTIGDGFTAATEKRSRLQSMGGTFPKGGPRRVSTTRIDAINNHNNNAPIQRIEASVTYADGANVTSHTRAILRQDGSSDFVTQSQIANMLTNANAFLKNKSNDADLNIHGPFDTGGTQPIIPDSDVFWDFTNLNFDPSFGVLVGNSYDGFFAALAGLPRFTNTTNSFRLLIGNPSSRNPIHVGWRGYMIT